MVNGTYFAYSAFLDSRKACTLCPVVRWRRKQIGKLEIIHLEFFQASGDGLWKPVAQSVLSTLVFWKYRASCC